MKNNALTPRRVDLLTPHQTAKALRTLELVIDGRRWSEIKDLGGYGYREFSGLLAKYPDLARSYQEARALSGTTFEDKALELADKLASPNEFTGVGVRSLEAAMAQYRWSATKRDPRSYAEASASTGTMVPIQINTTLNLGQGGPQVEQSKTVWEVQAEVLAAGGPAAPEPASPESAEPSWGMELPPDDETPVDTLPDKLAEVREKVHLPQEVPAAIKKRPSPGRPKKGHKGPAATGVTRGTYARMKKSPAVKRALGLEDEDNGSTEHVGGKHPGTGRR